jgi:hypothetical protein
VAPSEIGSFVVGRLRMPLEVMFRVGAFGAVGFVCTAAAGLSGSLSTAVAVLVVSVLPYVYIRFIAMPGDLRGLVETLGVFVQELSSRQASRAPES